MAWGPLLIAIIKAMFGVFVENSKDTADEAVVDRPLKSRLQEAIRKAKRGTLAVLLLLALPGCFTRTVYVREGTPVRLAAPVPNHPVWVILDGTAVKSRMDLDEGLWVLSDPGED